MRRSTSIIVATSALLLATSSGWFLQAISLVTLLQAPAIAADLQGVAKEAEAISVRIQGATSGTGPVAVQGLRSTRK